MLEQFSDISLADVIRVSHIDSGRHTAILEVLRLAIDNILEGFPGT